MAQRVKLFVDKPAYLSSVPGAHMVEGKNQLLQVIVLGQGICISTHFQLVNKQKDLRKEVELSSHSESCFAFQVNAINRCHQFYPSMMFGEQEEFNGHKSRFLLNCFKFFSIQDDDVCKMPRPRPLPLSITLCPETHSVDQTGLELRDPTYQLHKF